MDEGGRIAVFRGLLRSVSLTASRLGGEGARVDAFEPSRSAAIDEEPDLLD
jgi:hypothetical protein